MTIMHECRVARINERMRLQYGIAKFGDRQRCPRTLGRPTRRLFSVAWDRKACHRILRFSRTSPRQTWRRRTCALLLVAMLLATQHVAKSQVGPAEITDPQLKSLEAAYLPQLVSMDQAIARITFPFAFNLSRYVGLDPKQQAGIDARGMEFVLFHDRMILKTSGNYNAAFDSLLLTQNQRANRVFTEVIAPILRLFPEYFTAQAGFDSFGFEISYHVRTHSSSYDYEGKEIFVIVLDKADALAYPGALTESARQNILNASEVYVNGKEFGLALNAANALGSDELAAHRRAHNARARELVPAVYGPAAHPNFGSSDPRSASGEPAGKQADGITAEGNLPGVTPANPKNAEVETLQNRLQSQLDALGKEGVSHCHFVDYAPPSLVIVRNLIHLQMTLRNPNPFDKSATSIYKRTAQSFDLFLAPLLKPLLDRAPSDGEIAGFDITVLNQFGINSKDSPEAIEFIFPLRPLRQFADAGITNQDLINQSVVIVNGVRIALDLQRVE